MATLALLAALLVLPQGRVYAADPVFNASLSATISVAENTTSGTNIGSPYTATDGDSDTLTYSLADTVMNSGDAAEFTITSSGQIQTSAALDHETQSSYAVTVGVSDGKDADMADTAVDITKDVTITVTNVDEAGTVTIMGTLDGGVELTASVSDLDGSVTGESWQWARADMSTGTFTDIDSATNAKYTSVAADVNKFLRATVTYKDAESTTVDKTAEAVTTSAIAASNSKPTFPSSETGARNVDENTAANVDIGSPVAATDSDTSDTLTYALTGTDAGSFNFDTTSGQIKTKAPLDHETKGSYTVDVTVRDSKDAAGDTDTTVDDTITVTITVNNVNEAPTITSSGSSFTAPSFDENGSGAVETYTATDVDASTTLTWSLDGGDDESDFSINPNSGALTFNTTPNYESPHDADSDNEYHVTVKVTDNGIPDNRVQGNRLDDTLDVTITVDDVNEAPTITTSDTTKEVPENTTTVLTFAASDVDNNGETEDSANTLTWSVEDSDDGGKFTINSSSGALTFTNAPDYETPNDVGDTAGNNTYVATVKVTDNGIDGERGSGNHLNDTHEITVTVTNVNEAPTITTNQTTHTAPSKMEIEYDDDSPDLSVVTYTASDPDTQTGNTLTWTLEGDDTGDFDIDSGTGALSFKNPPNYEIPIGTPASPGDPPDNTYEITVKVIDNGIPGERGIATWLDATQDVVVTVTDVNERPDIGEVTNDAFEYLEVDFYYTLTPDSVHTFTATDYDDMAADPFTWSLGGDDMGDFSIGSSDGVLTFNQDTSLNVGPLPSFEDPQDDDTDNTYEITIIATDDDMYAAEYAVTIEVTDAEEEGTLAADLPNDPPLVDDVLTFTLSDPDGGILLTDGDIDWTVEARQPAEGMDPAGDWESVDDDDPLSLVKTYTLDEDYTGKGIRATVEYEDRRGSGKIAESDDTDSAVDDRDVAPPRFREGATQTIAEGPAGRDTEVEIMATDRDGEVLIFGIQDGKDADLFEIIPSDSTVIRTIQNVDYTGYAAQLRAIEALDYETVTSDDPDCPSKSLCLTLTLSDGKKFSNGRVVYNDEVDVTYDVTIEVTDAEEPGEITFSPEEVPEPGVQITATHSDPDGSISGRSWQWQRSEDPEADPPAWEYISGATSSTYTPSATNDVVSGGDNDGDGYYLRATVTYTDGEGSGKSAMADAGQVGTANTRPQFPATDSGQRAVPENSRAGTNIGDPVAAEDLENNSLTYTLSEDSVHGDAFTIVSSTGQLRVKEPLDFEAQEFYIVTIEVSDRRDAAGRSSTRIDDTIENAIIRVENVEEEGTVTLTTDTNKIQATVPIVTELSDPDIPNSSTITWQWARSANRSDWTDIATSATYTPTEADDQGNYLRATASYTDGEGSGKKSEAITPRVAASPPTNAGPVFPDSEDGQREVREDAGTGTTIGSPVQAIDFNNDTLTYSLSGSDASFYTIEANGQVRLELEQDESLDYERKRSYRFTVQVSDGANDDDEPDDRIDDSVTVTVSLIDVNEPPVITGEPEREFRENSTSPVATYSARDPEGDRVSWSLSGLNSPNFVITDRGQLYFYQPPSFEDGATYRVTVTATDDGEPFQLSASLNVTVTVTDVEERGEVTLHPTKGWVADAVEDDPDTMDVDETLPALQTRFTAKLEDGDSPITNLSWQWARSSSEDVEGATSSGYTAISDDLNRTLRVTATYEDNRSTDPETMVTTENSVTASLRSSVRDTSPGVNTQPRFTVPTAEELPGAHFDTRTITSGAVAGRNIGSRVSARDAEGDVLTYMLRGRDAEKFELDSATGQIRTKAALDYLDQDTYTLSVSVHDGFDVYYRPSESIDDTISIIITVLPPPPPPRRVRRTTTDDTPPNRPAEFSDGETTNRSVVQGTEAGTDIGRPVSASDPDGDTLTYTLGGDDAESFDIDAMTGQLKTKTALDAETKSSYSVTVSVTDNKNAGGGRLPEIDDTITVVITVTAVELPEPAMKYDTDENGLISREEALAAVNDFFNGDITRDEALKVIVLYFDSPVTATELADGNE